MPTGRPAPSTCLQHGMPVPGLFPRVRVSVAHNDAKHGRQQRRIGHQEADKGVAGFQESPRHDSGTQGSRDDSAHAKADPPRRQVDDCVGGANLVDLQGPNGGRTVGPRALAVLQDQMDGPVFTSPGIIRVLTTLAARLVVSTARISPNSATTIAAGASILASSSTGSMMGAPYMTLLADVTARPTNENMAMKGGRPKAWPATWARWLVAYLYIEGCNAVSGVSLSALRANPGNRNGIHPGGGALIHAWTLAQDPRRTG